MWLDPLRSGQDLVWRHPCLADIIDNLVSASNRLGTITNYERELSWRTKEASMINPVVADLLRIHRLHSGPLFTNPSIFNHPGIENHMADDASRLFELSDTSLLAHMFATYLQLQCPCQISLPPLDMLSCVISTLRRKPCKRELHKMIDSRISTTSRSTSAPPCKSTLISKIHPSLALRSYKSTDTASDTPSTPIAKWTDLGRSRFFRYGGQLQQPTPWLAS